MMFQLNRGIRGRVSLVTPAQLAMLTRRIGAGLAATLVAFGSVGAQQKDTSTGSIVETVRKLKPGEYVWTPQIAPGGPMLLVVSLASQKAILFRNGVPIGATTISTGRPGYSTPTGAFTILQKHVEHHSSKYDDAPMPYMQRLTWYGIALHAGNLPGYPASHGCIRLPSRFAKLLYDVSKLGMTVAITDRTVIPRLAPTPGIAIPSNDPAPPGEILEWHPERSSEGPVSIVVSAADRRAVVLRNGIVIGSGPVLLDGPVTGAWAYTLRNIDAAGQHWLRLPLSSDPVEGKQVAAEEWQRFHASDAFKKAIASIVAPGTTIIVTPDSVRPGGEPIDIIEADAPVKN